jgi:L-arabinokinase
MIVFYISGHGFGHASRDLEVIRALHRRQPDRPVVVRTGVPAWLFEASAERRLDVQPLETDSGIAQIDSLTQDERETARRAVRFYENFEERVLAEAAWLAANRAALVVADVPPLACLAAAHAGLPSVLIGNFTWDWIYRGLPGFEALAPGVIPRIERAYAAATHALRLPMHGGFESLSDRVRDVPFIARRAAQRPSAVRSALGLEGSRPVALASFGGHGLRLPYSAVAATGRLTILLTEFEAEANPGVADLPNVRCVSGRELANRQLRHEDLVAAADVVIGKPGYGIVSECIANSTAFLYTSRGTFPEYEVMTAAMPTVMRCRFIERAALLAGDWVEAIEGLLQDPPPPTRPMTNGADVAADFLLRTAQRAA